MLNEPRLIVVSRSSGERTSELSRVQLCQQLDIDHAHVVREAPLSASLMRTFDLAIESGADWLVICDADVVLSGGGIRRVLAQAQTLPDSYIQLSARVQDMVFGDNRARGVRVYRASLLDTARQMLAERSEFTRPESGLLSAMSDAGIRSGMSATSVGFHDFEQWHVDLYRKGYFFAHKHLDKLPALIGRCRVLANESDDFRTLLAGIADGISNVEVGADTRRFDRNEILSRLATIGIVEKPREIGQEFLAQVRDGAPSPSSTDYWETVPFPEFVVDQWKEFQRRPTAPIASFLSYHNRAGLRNLVRALRR